MGKKNERTSNNDSLLTTQEMSSAAISKRKKSKRKKEDHTIEDNMKTEEPSHMNGSSRMRRHKRNGILSKVVKVALVVVLVAVLGVVAWGAKILTDADNLIDNAYKPVKRVTSVNDNIDPIKDPIAILILGLDNNDERQLESTRTDAMLVATVSPDLQKISMVSIPRDTFTKIEAPEFEGMDKINAAYAYGEVESTIKSVENLLDFPINYYVSVDFNAFESIVDAFGGVEVDVPVTFVEQNAKSQEVVKLEEGRNLLNGEQALAFARTRKIDNDVMRGSRQQQIMEAVLKKAMNIGSITKFQEVIKALNGHFWTDMDMSTMMKVAESGLKTNYTFESYIFSWMSFDYYGASMVGLHDDSLDFISHRLRLSLELDIPDERDEAGYKFESNGFIPTITFPQDGMAVIN